MKYTLRLCVVPADATRSLNEVPMNLLIERDFHCYLHKYVVCTDPYSDTWKHCLRISRVM
jgi:hypothetical protein